MKRLTVLGATGSIGASTLDVAARHPERFRIFALSAHRDVAGLLALCRRFQPAFAAMADEAAAARLRPALREAAPTVEVLAGAEGLEQIAAHPDTDVVMAAIVGAAGLRPTLAAARSGKRILLANKEALVMAGPLFMDAVNRYGAQLLPVDSEHNAVFQCLPAGVGHQSLAAVGVRRILLTASGGPFRTAAAAELREVTPEQACAHPNWDMGRKISVDSATMMNKGLEVIEACYLFGLPPARIEVVVHPQSVIHSLVEYADGSLLAQLGSPDMRTPIAHALAWPQRIDAGVRTLDLFEVARLEFEPPDRQRFPCLQLAYEALQAGGAAPAVLNAANEVAVQAFLERRISFTAIAEVVRAVLATAPTSPVDRLEAILTVDAEARCRAEAAVARSGAAS